MWNAATIPVSSSAAHSGSQLSAFQSAPPSAGRDGEVRRVEAQPGGALDLGHRVSTVSSGIVAVHT